MASGATAAMPKVLTTKKCLFYRHFRITQIFVEKSRVQIFLSVERAAAAFRVRSARMKEAAVTHKFMWSHCYFFFAVVIGW
jgi:hypothetical protein